MPPRGAISAKLGSRYEDLVAVRQLLELLDDRYDAVRMRLEQPGENGFEWWVEHGDRSRTYGQVKRQQAPDEEWNIATLATRGVLTYFAEKLRADPQAECEFFSTLSATHLQDLTESARLAPTVTEYEEHFIKGGKWTSWEKVCTTWGAGSEEAWQLLRHITVDATGESSLEKGVRDHIAALITGSPEAVLDFLLGFVGNKLVQIVEAEDVWTWLRDRGSTPTDWRQDASIRATIAETTDRFRGGLDEDCGPLPLIARSFAKTIADLLFAPDGPTVITVAAEAGMGKSTLLGQVLDHLAAGPTGPVDGHAVVLAVRLDQLPEFHDARGLGDLLHLPASPVLVLRQVAASRRTVLILDQVDAFSAASGRKLRALDAVSELLHQARSLGVRVVLACRAFDLEFDRRLSLLAGMLPNDQTDNGYHVQKLGPLSDEEVERALSGVNIDAAALTPSLRSLLAIPLHLQMLATLQQHGRLDPAGITTRLQLFERFFDDVCAEVELRQPNGPAVQASHHLAGLLSDRQELSAPKAASDQYRVTALYLISAGWFREESGRIRFGHEAYFDYAYAHRHMSSGLALLDLLRTGDQHLFRRSQVRQILTLEREQDRAQYVRDVGDLLAAAEVRPHIKEIVIALATRVPDPTIAEWRALQRLGDPQVDRLAEQAHALVCQAPVFGRLLLDEHIVSNYLSDPSAVGLGLWMCRLLARTYPAEIAALLRPHVGQPDWAPRLLGFLNTAPLRGSAQLVDLLEALLDSGGIDDVVRHNAPHGDFFMLLLGMTGSRASWGSRLVASWLRRRIAVLIEDGIFSSPSDLANAENHVDVTDDSVAEDPDDDAELVAAVWLADSRRLLDYTPSATQALATLACDDPAAYVCHILPVVRDAADRTRDAQVDQHGEYCQAFPVASPRVADLNPTDALLARLAQAIHEATEAGDADTQAAVRTMASSPLQVEQFLVAVGFAAGHADLLADALTWLETGPYALAQGWIDDPCGLSAAALAIVCEQLPIEATAAAQDRAAGHVTQYEQQVPVSGRSAHRLLRNIPDEHLTETVRARKQELATLFPEPPSTPAMRMNGFVHDLAVNSPISRASIADMSDDDLVAELRNISSDDAQTRPKSHPFGDRHEVAVALGHAAQDQPDRFIQLLRLLPSDIPLVYVEGILTGMTRAEITPAQRFEAALAARRHASGCSAALAELIRQAVRRMQAPDIEEPPAPAEVADLLDQLLRSATPTDQATLETASSSLSNGGEPDQEAGEFEGQDAAPIVMIQANSGQPLSIRLSQRVWQEPEYSLLQSLSTLADSYPLVNDLVAEHLHRLAGDPNLVLRAAAIEIAAIRVDQHVDAMMDVIAHALDVRQSRIDPGPEPIPALTALLLADPRLRDALLRLSWRRYDRVKPILDRMFSVAADTTDPDVDALLQQIGENAATVYAAAGCRDDAALDRTRQLLSGPECHRRGIAVALSQAVPADELGQDQIAMLAELFDDPDDQVVRHAITVLMRLPDGNQELIRELIAAGAASRAFVLIPGPVIIAADRHRHLIPESVLDVAERFIDLHSDQASDLTSGSSHNATTLSELVIGVYVQYSNHEQISARALDLIDQFVLARTFDIEDHLSKLDR